MFFLAVRVTTHNRAKVLHSTANAWPILGAIIKKPVQAENAFSVINGTRNMLVKLNLLKFYNHLFRSNHKKNSINTIHH